MERRLDRFFIFRISVIALLTLSLSASLTSFQAFAATSFGIDYRHLTTAAGGTPDTSTSVTVGSGATGTFIVNPYTSGSNATATPSISSLSGYGWRSAGVVGSSIPAGPWSFTITTQASLPPLTGEGKVKVYVYSTDTLGSNLSFVGNATGTINVFSNLTAQTETISFSAGSVDLTNKVLVVEYWIDVTSGPLLARTITFQAASSTQTVALPSSSGTFYLGMSSLFSVGDSESVTISEILARSLDMARGPTASAVITDPSASRNIVALRSTSEPSRAEITDSVSKFAGFARQVSENSGAVISDSISTFTGYARQVTENSAAVVTEGTSRVAVLTREISETPAFISDLLNAFLKSFNPFPSDNGNEGRGRRGEGGGFGVADKPPVSETPPTGDEDAVRNTRLNVSVSDTIGIRTEDVSLEQDELNIAIEATLKGISTSFQPIPPSAIGSTTFKIINNANSTERIIFSYWCIDGRTGVRILEEAEEITLLSHQTFSKSLEIPFLSPGQYSLEASAGKNDGKTTGIPAIQISVPWIAVYLNLLITIIGGTIVGLTFYRLIMR